MKAAVFLQVGQTDGRVGGFVWTELSVKLNLIGGWVSGKGEGGGGGNGYTQETEYCLISRY